MERETEQKHFEDLICRVISKIYSERTGNDVTAKIKSKDNIEPVKKALIRQVQQEIKE